MFYLARDTSNYLPAFHRFIPYQEDGVDRDIGPLQAHEPGQYRSSMQEPSNNQQKYGNCNELKIGNELSEEEDIKGADQTYCKRLDRPNLLYITFSTLNIAFSLFIWAS